MRDGQDREDDDDDDGRGMHQEMEPSGFEGRGGALVEEAKKMMQDDDDDQQMAPQDNAGPKIKMGRLGKVGKKKAGGAAASGAGGKGQAAPGLEEYKPQKSGGALSEKDYEFMKKAIQVLCQSTNPLGKSIDFVTDDIDSMNKEYEHWKKQS